MSVAYKIFALSALLFFNIDQAYTSNPFFNGGDIFPEPQSFGIGTMKPISFEADGETYIIRSVTEEDADAITYILCQKTPETYPYKDLKIFETRCMQCVGEGDQNDCARCISKTTHDKYVVTSTKNDQVLYWIEVSYHFMFLKEILQYYECYLQYFKKNPMPVLSNPKILDLDSDNPLLGIEGVNDIFNNPDTIMQFADLCAAYYTDSKEQPYHVTVGDVLNFSSFITAYIDEMNAQQTNETISTIMRSISPEDAKAEVSQCNETAMKSLGFVESDFKGNIRVLFDLIRKHEGRLVIRTDYYGRYDVTKRGVFSNALSAVRDQFFKNPMVGGICNILATNNIASRRVNEKLGAKQIFQLDEYREDATIGHPDGEFVEKMSVLFLENNAVIAASGET